MSDLRVGTCRVVTRLLPRYCGVGRDVRSHEIRLCTFAAPLRSLQVEQFCDFAYLSQRLHVDFWVLVERHPDDCGVLPPGSPDAVVVEEGEHRPRDVHHQQGTNQRDHREHGSRLAVSVVVLDASRTQEHGEDEQGREDQEAGDVAHEVGELGARAGVQEELVGRLSDPLHGELVLAQLTR